MKRRCGRGCWSGNSLDQAGAAELGRKVVAWSFRPQARSRRIYRQEILGPMYSMPFDTINAICISLYAYGTSGVVNLDVHTGGLSEGAFEPCPPPSLCVHPSGSEALWRRDTQETISHSV